MSFNNSDIFDAYAKLMLEKNANKIAQEKESKELKKYKNDSYPRTGSDTIKEIASKYNVKPEKPKSQEYTHNIMEVAHPHKVILNPAYDKINALIENNNERQRIIINITQKPVNGQLTQHKYAQTELAKSLIAIANDLDNRDIEPLRKLADECIDDLHKKAFEWSDVVNWFKDKGSDIVDVGQGTISGAEIGAVAGGLIGAFGGPMGVLSGAWVGSRAGALLGGVLSSIFNTSPQAKNVVINAQEAKSSLDNLLDDHKNDIFLTSLDTALAKIVDTAAAYAQIVDKMHIANDDPAAKQGAAAVATAYQTQLKELDRLIEIFLTNAKMGRYAPEESDTWSKIKSPFTNVFGSNVHTAIGAFETLEKVNGAALKGIEKTQGEVAQVASTPSAAVTPTAPTEWHAPMQTPAAESATSPNDKAFYTNWLNSLTPNHNNVSFLKILSASYQ